MRYNFKITRAKFKYILSGFLFVIAFISCNDSINEKGKEVILYQQFSDFEKVINENKDKILVINFWATTCPPCIKEMPHFNKLRTEFKNDEVEIFLLSLDNIKDLDKRVHPFVQKHNLKTNVGLLQDQNYSKWTEKIDSSWMGALPATLILNGNQRNFKFGMYESYEEILTDIEKVKNKGENMINFESEKWQIKEGGQYLYREQMLNDLIHNDSIRSLSQKELLSLLGPPKKIDNNHIFYLISEKKAIITLHTKTLVIKYKNEEELEWMKIHQ